MGRAKIAITLDKHTLRRLDGLVRERKYPNRSRAIEAVVEEKLERLETARLARECGKLDPAFEKALAEAGISKGLDAWPRC